MFTDSKGTCKCLPTGATDSGWTKCPSAGTIENGIAVCVSGTCSQDCFYNAVVEGSDCKPYPFAPSAQMITKTDKDCTGTNKVIGAYEGSYCQCQTPGWHAKGGGKVCKEGLPNNSFATCMRSETNVGDSYCSFQCEEGFVESTDLKSCIVKDVEKDEPATNKGFAPSCPDPMIVPYASAGAPCGCAPSLAKAKRRTPDAVPCTALSSHGKVGCKNTSAGSKCSVDCETGFKPSPDEQDCVLAHRNQTKSEFECGAVAGRVGFLSADPEKGCICETEKKPTFCGVGFGDDEAEMMCSDTTDNSGKRAVNCAIKCSDGYMAKDPNTSEKVEVEGESVTMAGASKPRDSDEVPCTEKVFGLQGKGGCKCASTAPAGATECPPGMSPNNTEYAICQYEKGSGQEASCTTECIKGTYKRGNVCR
ncbi:hypothetical protein B0H15DRAFT_848317 [Mycena belliarum]|uniref:Uncharacterized protein n=1 Tax=Mycena belliarum TaxID=1033014 RepID=A0AAD6U1H8_9AGAR|nr:hypothetical protein B0H15DRAFT_848317 [Mycena belliae]